MKNTPLYPLAMLTLAGIASTQQVTITARTDLPAVLQVAQAGDNDTEILSFGPTTALAGSIAHVFKLPSSTNPLLLSTSTARWTPTTTHLSTVVGGTYSFANSVFGPGGFARPHTTKS